MKPEDENPTESMGVIGARLVVLLEHFERALGVRGHGQFTRTYRRIYDDMLRLEGELNETVDTENRSLGRRE